MVVTDGSTWWSLVMGRSSVARLALPPSLPDLLLSMKDDFIASSQATRYLHRLRALLAWRLVWFNDSAACGPECVCGLSDREDEVIPEIGRPNPNGNRVFGIRQVIAGAQGIL